MTRTSLNAKTSYNKLQAETPIFSIIIPTGGRVSTLAHTLKTVLCQFGDDMELLVSDNDETLNTKSLIDQLDDSRIRYVKTPCRLSMTDHWNFAISNAHGEYLLILGDDDGLLPDAIERVRDLVRSQNPDVIYGPTDIYLWPVDAQRGKIPLVVRAGTDHQVDLFYLRRRILRMGGARWESLPSIYRAFVHRRVLEQLYATTGTYCDTLNPDMYLGFAIAGIPLLRVICLSYPIAIAATSYSAKQKQMPKIYAKETGLLMKHITEYGLVDYYVPLPTVFARSFNSFAESMMVALSRFPGTGETGKLNYSAHLAWMLSWSRADDPTKIWRLRSYLKPFGFDFVEFLLWYLAYRTRHMSSKIVSALNALKTSRSADLSNVYLAAEYLGALRRR